MERGLTEDDLRRIRQFVETPERHRNPDLLLPDAVTAERRDEGSKGRRGNGDESGSPGPDQDR